MTMLNCILVLILTKLTIATAPIDVIFLIRSQDTKYQTQLSRNLKENIIKQSYELQPNSYNIKVHVLHEIFNYPGDWTIHNLIPQLMLSRSNSNSNSNSNINSINEQIGREIMNDNTRWIVFCEDITGIKLNLLMERLNNENHTQPIYLGHPLYDREPTIIHHFAFFENPQWFPYPMLGAGVVLSKPLFRSIVDIYASHNNVKHLKQQRQTTLQRSEFSIDAAHELARFIYDNVQRIPTTTPSQNDYENPDVSVYQPTKPKTTIATATRRSTSSSSSNAADVVTKVSGLSHSEFRSNEIVDKHKDEKSSITDSSTTAKRQKIILKKASYICPRATWESGNRNNKKNNHNSNEACAMYAEQTTATSSMACIPAKREQIYFAVKTCFKHHHDRLPIIQTTWAPYAKNIKYFSDMQDDTIPTINTGIPNVEMGHCTKTMQILKLALRDIENYNSKNKHLHQVNQDQHESHQIQWLFLTDDDTLLSVSGVCQVLGCFDAMHDDIYLGERYGYRLYAHDGFNYITGGGGIVFSLSVVKLILQHCSCPSPSAPDDMILGSCLHSLQLRALHSSRFHQARPNDYPLDMLLQEPPVSFHKFWQLDPIDVYNRWFLSQDRQLLAEKQPQDNLPSVDHYTKSRKLLTKAEPLNLNDIPVSLVASLHHSKERHVDL